MTKKTIEEILKDAEVIDTTRPDEHHSDYFSWHTWRIRCVIKAIKLLAVRLYNMGYYTVFGENYIFAGKGDNLSYMQYHELEHFYGTATGNKLLSHNDEMKILSDDSELNEYFDKLHYVAKEKFIKDHKNASYLTEIVESHD